MKTHVNRLPSLEMITWAHRYLVITNMAHIHITKHAAAQRQVDAAIRILFSEEDPLAVHTVVAAAHRILTDLVEKHRKSSFMDDAYLDALNRVREHFPEKTQSWNIQHFKKWLRDERNRPANFLTHADQDADKMLNQETLKTDHLLLEACCRYEELGLPSTPEMSAFARWHLAVYPHEDGDAIETAAGFVDHLERTEQLEFGAFILKLSSATNNKE